MIDHDELQNGFASIIHEAAPVMFHSSYKSFGGVKGGPSTVIDALNAAAKPSAVFYPTYGVAAWCSNHYWHRSETPSEMGAITEVARGRNGTRTAHPIHSFKILGSWDTEYNFENVESYGDDGPLGLFHRQNGYIISAGVPWNDTFTFVHYVERKAGAPWRRIKQFAGIYVDDWGMGALRTYTMSVRKSLDTITNVAPLYDEYLVPRGIVKQVQIGQSTVSWFRAAEYFDAVLPLVKDKPEWFFYNRNYGGAADPVLHQENLP